jgi:uncharacterized protein
MQRTEILQILDAMHLPESALVETHISWVILTDAYAYKIKRPVQFSFLDFSTVALRHACCIREVELNRRLAGDMYIGVVPVGFDGTHYQVDGDGEVVDYAVKMHRLPLDRQMDHMLVNGKVTRRHITQIASLLARFHQGAERVEASPDPGIMAKDFADILSTQDALIALAGAPGVAMIRDATMYVRRFLTAHARRIGKRHTLGFVIDGHGDLHAKNIFLMDQPVIFDCIEFNDHFRQVDVLDELAFFCLDLDFYGAKDLASVFLAEYQRNHSCILVPEDRTLFQYFKLYRAGVKLKINLIKAGDATQSKWKAQRLLNANGYYRLFEAYFTELKNIGQS